MWNSSTIFSHFHPLNKALPKGLKDAEKCIELDPSFSKGYTRKGAIQFFMKEYDKALETYQEGLKHNPNN